MPRHLQMIVAVAAVVVVLVGLKLAGDLLTPLLFGLMVSAISAPLVIALLKRGVPPLLGAMLVIVLDMGVLLGFGTLLALGASELEEKLPAYVKLLAQTTERLGKYLGHDGYSVMKGDQLGNVLGDLAKHFASIASHMMIVLLVVFFTSWEIGLMLRKLRSLSADAPVQYARVNNVIEQVQRYMVVKTWTSALIALAGFVVLRVLSVSSSLLLALALFLLHFIPNVGAFIAAAPALLIAWAEHGVGVALVVALAYAVLNTLIGGILEPKMLGNRLGISPLFVLLGMLFWGWMWGPMGALLSVPLLVVFRLVLVDSRDFSWLVPWIDAEPDLPSLSRHIAQSRLVQSLRWRPRVEGLEPSPPTQPAARPDSPTPEPPSEPRPVAESHPEPRA